MKINCVQRLIDIIRGKKYVKIYSPIYFEHVDLVPQKPDIYNCYGQKMDTFFLRDHHIADRPYWSMSKYFLWDRFNIALDTHFYTGRAMHETMGNPTRKFSFLLEPRSKKLNDYLSLEKNSALSGEFDKVLTHDARLLEKLPNAFFFPGCAAAWISPLPEDAYLHKTKNVSMVSSHKKMCPMHCLRIAVAQKCKKQALADTFGTFDGGPKVPMLDVLKDYRYTIAFENEINPYFFTERLISAFLSFTIPIYLGATEVGKFFNSDGIICIDKTQAQNIEEVLKQCSVADYEQRIEAMKDNYKRALSYLNPDDLLYESLFLPKDKRTLACNFNFLNEGR